MSKKQKNIPMTNQSGFFSEIISRRIPQYIGMYIAALWVAVEIADWMSEKFSVPDQFSTYVFIGMLAMLPMIILFAWGHGRPGKDDWSKAEVIWLPINLILAYFVAMQFGAGNNIQEQAVTDKSELLELQSSSSDTTAKPEPLTVFEEVKKQPNHQSVISFFWSNETGDQEVEWLRYGAPWLVSQDLKRTPVLSVRTPYDSKTMLNEIQGKGFDMALDVPKALALQVASSQSAKWMILGSIHEVGGTISFTARVIDVLTGNELKSMTVSNVDVLSALDKISKELSVYLHENSPKTNNVIADLAIAEHTSDDLVAIEHLIDAKNHVAFENDYHAGLEDVYKALDQDERFAEANVLAVSYYRSLGDIPNAVEHTKKALMLDYKVYQEKVFSLRANLFGMTGEQNKAMTVLENWVKVYPASAAGLTTLGRNYIMLDKLENAKEVYEKLIQIDQNQDESLVSLGRIYRLEDNKDKAIESLKTHLENNPTKAEAYIELADAYKQFLMLDQAHELYEQASAIGSNDLSAEIGMAYIAALRGNIDESLNELHELLASAENDQQKLNVLMSIQRIYMQTGQLIRAQENNNTIKIIAEKILNPLHYLFTVEGMDVEINVMGGHFDLAQKKIESIKNETKPPFNQIASAFHLIPYEVMGDYESYEANMNQFEAFMQEFPMPAYEQMLISWKGKVASWKGDYEQALLYFDDALERAKKSFVRLQTIDIINEILYAKAHTLMDMGLYKDSIGILDHVLAQDPLFGRAQYLKAKNFILLNDMKQAALEVQSAQNFWQNADPEFIMLDLLIELENEIHN